MPQLRSARFTVLLFATILTFLIALPTFAGLTTKSAILGVTRDNCVLTIQVVVNEDGPYYIVILDDKSIIASIPFDGIANVPQNVLFTITQPAGAVSPGIDIIMSGDPEGVEQSDSVNNYLYPDDLAASCTPKAGAVCSIVIPADASVGNLAQDTQAFWAPGKISPDVVVKAGTYWVVAEEHDDAGDYFYKIILACQFLYVPVDAMSPSYQYPWDGQPLPSNAA